MSLVPDDLKFTKEHEWVSESGVARYRVGITDYAQGALGDIVYVQLPKVGEIHIQGKVCGEVESTKSVSEIYAPVSGVVTAVNSELEGAPELMNRDPYGSGWIYEIEISAPEELTGLLDSAGYRALTA